MTIKDVKFRDVKIDIKNGKNVGTLIGFIADNDKFIKSSAKAKWVGNTTIGTDDLTVTNVIAESGSVTAAAHVGGLVGKIYVAGTHTFDNCVNGLTITQNSNDGGLAEFVLYISYDKTVIFNLLPIKSCD